MSNAPPPMHFGQETPPKKPINLALIIAAVLVGGCSCVGVLLAAILFPVFQSAKVAAKNTACLSNVKQLALANLMYAGEHDDKLPRAGNWCDAVERFATPSTWKCPVAKATYSYALNKAVSGKSTTAIKDPATTLFLFEPQTTKKNASGDALADQAKPGRHSGRNNFAYVDGHAKRL